MSFSMDDPTNIKKRAATSRHHRQKVNLLIVETIPAIMKAGYHMLGDELRACSGTRCMLK
jgi:hypothetical protein